jgi:leucyl-tRNA---protein transferase
MQIIQPAQMEEISECPYLPGRRKRYEFFLAGFLTAGEIAALLAEGWRKFGFYFFRPACPDCRLCIPVRTATDLFTPSRSQRRVLRRGEGLRVEFGELQMRERIFEIYRKHSLHRFAQEANRDDFLFNFYLPSCPSIQTEIYLGNELIGAGFLDRGGDCLSTVYFCYDLRFSRLSPGIFSALKEVEHARSLGLPYYYLGYWVPGCSRMAYKENFRPREYFDWQSRRWIVSSESNEAESYY